MDTKLNKLLILISLILIIGMCLSQVPETCYSYRCDTLDNQLCSKKNTTTTPVEFVFQKCASSGQFCPFEKEHDSDTCTAISKLKNYPGGDCVSSSDCVEGSKCTTNNTCSGSGLNEQCTKRDECLIGLTCLNVNATNLCRPQLGEGERCDDTYDCLNKFGCYQNKCTKYYSLPDNSETNDANMCLSGFVLNDKCITLSNVNATDMNCTTDCLYKDANGTNVTIPNSCKCGFNRESSKYCDLGSNSEYYKDLVTAARSLLDFSDKCHTLERGDSCIAKSTDTSFAFRKTAQRYWNNNVYAKNYPKLVNSDSCVKYVAFHGYDDTPIAPPKFQCAKFTCRAEGKNCLVSGNPFRDDGSGVWVNLTKGICHKNETCYVGPKGVPEIYDEITATGVCRANSDQPLMVLRYPGEDCTKNEDCFSQPEQNGTCTNNKCAGKAENENCTTTDECVVGTYCNGKTCVKQLGEDKNCTETWDCKNNLGCYKNKCVVLGSLKTGEEVSKNTLGSFADNPNRAYFCEFGTYNMGDGAVCARFDYASGTPNSDGFVTCNWGDDCKYTDGKTNFTQRCDCGYNAEGQGYCPLSQKYNEKDWKNGVLSKIQTFKNECHSKNRFNCYKPVDSDLQTDIKTYSHKTIDYHLYYKAVDCALEVLSGSYIQYSIVIFFALLAFLL